MRMAMSSAVAAHPGAVYVPIPLSGLAGMEPLPFPLYLRTAGETWVLYRDLDARVGEDQVERLIGEGVTELYIAAADRPAYLHRIERCLDRIVHDRSVSIERRADVLHGVAVTVVGEVLHQSMGGAELRRAQRLLVTASGLVVREQKALGALRCMLNASHSLVQHSVTVAFLSMGLARHAISAEPNVLVMAGLCGMFHDIGRAGFEELGHDPEHVQRGFELLTRLGLPREAREAALLHHERRDGSGFPRALAGEQIPMLSRIVGIVDVFDKVYSTEQPRVGVFDALRILAQAYRGCFDEPLAVAFVRLFR